MKNLPILFIILITTFLRFYNLMHGAPYFFNPDERNMANSITQFRLPTKSSQIPICLISQISPILSYNPQLTTHNLQPGSCNLNPNFFAYGQFPLYLAYFSDQLTQRIFISSPIQLPTYNLNNPASHLSLLTSFENAIFYLRFFSALSSTLTVLLVYLITKELFNRHSGKPEGRIQNRFWTSQNNNMITIFPLIASIFAAFTPGLIQGAHFGTTESLLTFFFMLSVYLSIKLLNQPINISLQKYLIHNTKYIILFSLLLGLALGTKLTGLFFFIPPFLALMIQFTKSFHEKKKNWLKNLLVYWSASWRIGLLLILGSIVVYILSSPFNFIDYPEFHSAVFGYEHDVATGRYEAFYTRQFVDTLPIFFQSEKIFPHALGWPIFILGSVGLAFAEIKFLQSLVRPQQKFWQYTLIIFSFFFYLFPNSILFAKWTRFMTPILPFFAIFSAYFLYVILRTLASPDDSRILPIRKDSGQDRMTYWKLGYCVIGFLVFIGIITPGLAFFSIYTRPDTRLQASYWIYQNIPDNSYILSETGNVIDIPLYLPTYNLQLTTYNYTVISFDFYHLDENPLLYSSLLYHLEKADYIFIPSRRIFANYNRLSKKYPLVTKYYQLLSSGALGFEEITRISSFPKLSIINYQLTIPDESAEETFTVFDHPVIRIYKKIKQLTQDQYLVLFR